MSYEAGKATREHEKTLYSRLLGYLSEVEIAGVKATGEQIIDAAGGLDQLPQYKLMVAYGGGKDSTYVVAFVRAVQLYLQDSFDRTFVMRVANMRHAGVPQSVMDNIDRVYRALGLLEDERVELITVDHTLIRPFQRVLPLPERMIAINRVDVLMNGHRSAGDGRPTFCNSCNLSVADFYGRAAWWQGGVDAVVTGDSRREQLLYSAWILRLAKASGIDVEQCRKMGFQGLLIALRGIGDAYFRELFGDDAEAELSEREVSTGGRSVQPEFISIYDHVSYRVHDHWDLIVDFLGFQFDDLAFSFSESDCANPNLMAHLRGLRTQYVQNRTYEDGITEYLHLGKELMEKKEMPEHLAQLVLDRYDSPEKMGQRRRLSADFARDAFGLEEPALVAMVFSPFTDEGERLQTFIDRCHPDMSDQTAQLRAALSGESDDAQAVAWLESTSALSLGQLRTLYRSSLTDFEARDSVIARVRAGDPHKTAVETVDPRTGGRTLEIISGR
ncbi:hypothetical protein BIV25_22625 [Streptomyces sp. MUSC 14]|uniref:hypothetical protein n=1 Tax=Streptomyces sp. MUSC 14 TaxID=1354889 RepID=UPI0008F56177|nr:hypothetical protein [Streptomyces sp. MUSC 14]OIJ94401.1 hypothetical protein BIV25_22625 [Streptomyces sp. MUSC 14]